MIRSLSAADIALILGVSRSHAYALIRTMPHEALSPQCLRVREDDFNAWRLSRRLAACDSTSAGVPGGSAGDGGGNRRGARTAKRPSSTRGDSSAGSQIPHTRPRTKGFV